MTKSNDVSWGYIVVLCLWGNSSEGINIVQENGGILLVDDKGNNIVNILSNGQISVFMLAHFFAGINARNWGNQFAPPEKVYTVWKPYGIILGLNITEEGKALVLSAADTAGIKNIFQLEISNEDDLKLERVR